MLPVGRLSGRWHLSEDLDLGSGSIIMTLNKPLNPKKSVFSFAKQEWWHLPSQALEYQYLLGSLNTLDAWLPVTVSWNILAITGAGMMKSRDVLWRRAHHLSWGSVPFWASRPCWGRRTPNQSVFSKYLGSTDFPLPPPAETQNPYSKKEPFDKTQALLCSNTSFNPVKVSAWYSFSGDPQAEMRSPEFIPLAYSHPLWNVIWLA